LEPEDAVDLLVLRGPERDRAPPGIAPRLHESAAIFPPAGHPCCTVRLGSRAPRAYAGQQEGTMSEQAQRPSDWKDPLVRKIVLVGGLVVLLLLPIEWIRGLIGKRQARHAGVKTELASTWGGQQTLAGPVVTLPYQEHWKTKDGEPETRICRAYFLPE